MARFVPWIKRGRPQFANLLFHRGNYPRFLAFDLLMRDGKDCRRERLLDRKQELRRVLSGSDARIQYVDYVDSAGIPLFEQACQRDLEGIVAKQWILPQAAESRGCYCPELFHLQLHQNSSYTSRVASNGGWRHRSPLGCE
jgi:ATP-dependent DNA ligase